MQNVINLQNSLLELQSMISGVIEPVFNDLQNTSSVFDPVISSHTLMIQKIEEMTTFLNSGIIVGLTGNDGYTPIKGIDYFDGVDGTNAPPGLLAEYVVTGSPVSSIDFEGLDINAHKGYRIEFDCFNNNSLSLGLLLYVNDDMDSLNYATQLLGSNASSVVGSPISGSAIGYCQANSSCFLTTSLSLSNSGYFRSISFNSRGSMTAPSFFTYATAKSGIVLNITKLSLVCSSSTLIPIGSRIRIFRGDT